MAAMTRKLTVLDYLAGTLGLGCGVLNRRFKIAAGAAIVLGAMAYVFTRYSAEHVS